MYIFNRITVNPQLPRRIHRLLEISNNLWWAWNTEFLQLFKSIDEKLWLEVGKSPIKFLKIVDQRKLERAAEDFDFLRKYDKLVENFDDYMESKNTWFSKNYPDNKDNLIAYFSAEYGLDEILPIYSGGLGILSGDHLKSASDLGVPFVAVGLLYKNGYFHQKINADGSQVPEYKDIDLYSLPINPVKTETGEDLITYVRFARKKVYLKVWQINVGRVKLYLLDSDIPENTDDNIRQITLRLYGGDQDMRIKQEIILGMAGTNLFNKLDLKPTVYHMNEGHSAFVTVELIRDIMEKEGVTFEIAKSIVSSKTVFTTHTPVPAGNDIFPVALVEKYFKDFWGRIGLDREEFLKLGMKETEELEPGFNMGILALKIAGKKNGVSKLHGEVSKELFGELWPEIITKEAPIEYVTNGIHTCSWLGQNIKELYNKYLMPYWQDKIHLDDTWKDIKNIPDEKLWKEHLVRKEKLINLLKQDVTTRYKQYGKPYDEIKEVVSKLNPNALTIGFARRFATYKRAALIFKDLERITKILNNPERPVQLIFSGKAHPADKEGQDVLKYINEIALMPQFKGKIFVIENYNIAVARYLVSGVDVWLNNPRRPMEASGTSGQKAAANGVINFSVLDGWWAEGYNGKNGWAIGTNATYDSYEAQDVADSESIYNTLEKEIIPIYYNRARNGLSQEWIAMMKESIMSNAGRFSTARMVVDYVDKLYMPLCNLTENYYSDISKVEEFNNWKDNLATNWNKVVIKQTENEENLITDVGSNLTVQCVVTLPNISPESVDVQLYYGKISDKGTIEDMDIISMTCIVVNEKQNTYEYQTTIELNRSGNYGYTFRVMPKSEMILRPENLNLVKWIVK